jgi:hypothetical protein
VIPPLDPRKWPGLIALIVELTYTQIDSWGFSPFTDNEIKELSGKREKHEEKRAD